MTCIWQYRPGVIWYGALHMNLEDLKDACRIKQVIDQDLERSAMTWSDLYTNKVVLDFRAEGHDHTDIELLIDVLQESGVKDFCVAFNAVVDIDKLNYPAECFATHLVDNSDFFTRIKHLEQNLDTDCQFLCLIRTPDHTRATFASQLVNLPIDIRLSFGAGTPKNMLAEFKPYFGRRQLPLIVDGIMLHQHCLQEHDISSTLFRKCAVNIVVESSCQQEHLKWHSIFITEKTFKAFAMWQLPIWWAVPGLVTAVKNLGFDVFDDIIDHSYDHEHNQETRMQILIDEIQRLNRLNLTQIRNNVHDRLAANWNHLAQMIEEQPEKNYQAWQRLIG